MKFTTARHFDKLRLGCHADVTVDLWGYGICRRCRVDSPAEAALRIGEECTVLSKAAREGHTGSATV